MDKEQEKRIVKRFFPKRLHTLYRSLFVCYYLDYWIIQLVTWVAIVWWSKCYFRHWPRILHIDHLYFFI